MPDIFADADLTALAEVMRTLGHDTRLQLVSVLFRHGETSVSEIQALTGIGQPGLSQQLAVLRKAELVTTRRAAKQVYCSLASAAFRPLAGYIAVLGKTEPSARSAPDQPRQSPTRGSAAMFAKIL